MESPSQSKCPGLRVSMRRQCQYYVWFNTCLLFRLVGFDDLGGTDSFSTALLEFKLSNAGESHGNSAFVHGYRLLISSSQALSRRTTTEYNMLRNQSHYTRTTMTLMTMTNDDHHRRRLVLFVCLFRYLDKK
jgi:hypothetical protein